MSQADLIPAAFGMGTLEPFLRDDRVSDVLVNGDGRVWCERDGALEATGLSLSEREVRMLIERAATIAGRRIDQSSPMVDARLPDGSRVHAITAPLAVDGPCLSIRRFRMHPLSLDELASPSDNEVLIDAMLQRKTVLVVGSTGSGKTTLLNALAAHIPADERLISIEEAAELRLGHVNIVRLETREQTADGPRAVTIRHLVRAALRMRPDRIIIGEVRGEEAFDMLGALNTGHRGSMTTVHANSPAEGLLRIESLAMTAGESMPLWAIREQVLAGFDLVVQMARQADGSRRVVATAAVADLVLPEPR